MFFSPQLILPTRRKIAVAASGTVGAFDSTNKSTHITLSSSDTVATATAGASGSTFVRSTTGHSTGKWYAEFTLTNLAAANTGVGLVDSTGVPDAYNLSADNHSWVCWDDHNIYQNNATLNSLNTNFALATGDVVRLAIDLGSSLLWVKKASGTLDWNAIGGADPATGVGGITFAALTGTAYMTVRMDNSGDVWTSSLTSNALGLPSGFSMWG